MRSRTDSRALRLRLLAFFLGAAVFCVIGAASEARADVLDPPAALPASYRDEVMADHPAAYWRLGEATGTVAYDEAGTSNGTYAGGFQLGVAGGLRYESNTAVTFNGTTGRMVVPDSNTLDATAGVTVELWVKRTKSAAYQVIVGKPGNGQSKLENYALWFNTSNRIQAYFGDGVGFVTATSGVIDTNWHHVVATYNNSVARLYVDGSQVSSATSTIVLTPNALPLNLARSNADTYYFGGSLDEVAIYGSALTATRIQAHYARSSLDVTPPTITIASPGENSVTSDASPLFSGVAGVSSGDLPAVKVRVYAGGTVGGTPAQTLNATADASGAYSVRGSALVEGSYTAVAEQSDGAGNVGTSAPRHFGIDLTAPSASIESGPTGTITATSVSFVLGGGEPGGSFQCSLDGAAFSSCTSPKAYSGLADGPHTFGVRAVDAAGNVGEAASAAWSVDTIAPSADIASRPPVWTPSTSALLEFSASEQDARLECRLDGAPYAACGSPVSYTELAEGPHAFDVRAIDAAGNVGSAQSATWTVDGTAPAVTLTAPADGSSLPDATPSFSGTAGREPGDAAVVTVHLFEGTDTSAADVQTLSAPVRTDGTYVVEPSSLPEGVYTARATQSDAAGNVGATAANTFEINLNAADVAPPILDLATPGQGATTSDSTPTFSGTAGIKPGDADAVRVNVYAGTDASGTPVQALDAPRASDGSYAVDAEPLSDGTYTARGEQRDAAGNVGTSPTRTFTVDTNPPTASIDSGPSGTINAAGATFNFSANEQGSSFECRLDAQDYVACTAPRAYSGLGDGQHTFRVRATDSVGNVGDPASRSWEIDTTPPAVTLVQPADGSSTSDPTPAFTGTAGTAAGDAANVTVRLYAGTAATGTPVQTLSATPAPDGAYSVKAAALQEGTYTARAQQSDAPGNTGFSASRTFKRADPVLIGAGDIAGCETGDGDAQTAQVLSQFPDATVFTLGDNAYPNGAASDFANCYNPTWGAHKARTRPVPGGHDLAAVAGAQPGDGYVNYFRDQLTAMGASAVDRLKLYYSYDVGTWHVVALNAGCYGDYQGCDRDAMERWFRQDLADHPNSCTVAMWHDARWSSGVEHGNSTFTQGLWKIAYDEGVDLVLSGHDHDYERFAPQDANGAADPQYGVREFVVGTGGYYFYNLGVRKANSEVFQTGTYGALKLTLRPGSYAWDFVPQAGQTFTDSGTQSCHDAPPSPPGAPSVRSSAANSANHPSTALTIAKPAAVEPGDLLLAVVSHQGGSIRNMTAPAGWTAAPNTDVYESTNARIHAWYRIASGMEPASYTFTLTGGSGMALAGGVAAIEHADALSPIAASLGQSSSAQSITLTAPSLTVPSPNSLLVYGGAVNAPVSFTAPQLMAERWDLSTTGQYNVGTEMAAGALTLAGATGTRTATLSAKAKGAAILIAVNPD